jgi:hypothetical protein
MIGESSPIKEADNDQTFVGSEGAERRRENNGASGERNGIGFQTGERFISEIISYSLHHSKMTVVHRRIIYTSHQS